MASKAPKPTARERAAERVCPNCGKPSPARRSPKGPAPLYCDDKCKRETNNRNLRDGLALVPYLKAWRIDRGSGPIAQTSFARVCQIVDELNEADREAGRPRADYYAAVLIESQAPMVTDIRYGQRKVAEARARNGEEAPQRARPAHEITALRARIDNPETTDNERAVLAAALEILSA